MTAAGQAPTRLQLELRDDPRDIMPRVEAIEAFLNGAGCSPVCAQQMAIVAEEILTNVVREAWTGREPGLCRVDVEAEPRDGAIHVTLRTEDDGVEFDPTAAEAPDLDAPLEEREIGGLGIVLVKQMTDRQTYRREDGRNIFAVMKVCAVA
ncbi:MAG: ATP-binding protein [Acetobacteraceae bacterium]